MALKHRYVRASIAIAMIAVACNSFAAVAAWQIDPNKSSIVFTGTLNGAPTSGQFKSFSGDIHFDPNNLKESAVQISVDMNSVTTSYPDIANTLKMQDWFNVKIFPQAVFKASNFTKTGEHSYQADGTLTIKNKSLPVVINFDEEHNSDTAVKVHGSTMLKRLQFDIGQGEWADTDAVKDEVKVDFTIGADRK